ncbi:MAG: hypothetical protein A2Y89_06730 [Chloroflexi bacterium RBG_13_51_18]|nr:MAG: hypothetical protein A2Y89_06730 [Chloroflexi bacterium RBG_13_51_18]
MDNAESKNYSWKWATADELLSHGPCELIYARTMSADAESDTFIYDGENTTGVPIIEFENGVKEGQLFAPPVPVYCRQGLYVDIGTNTIGVFVLWRGLP